VQNWSFPFLLIAAFNFVGNGLRMACSFIAGERLNQRLRKSVFESILHQRPGWFDDPAHGGAKLAHLLDLQIPRVRTPIEQSSLTHTHTHTHIEKYIYIHTHTHSHTHTHTHTHTHMYIDTSLLALSSCMCLLAFASAAHGCRCAILWAIL
jgi:hypothetical protein